MGLYVGTKKIAPLAPKIESPKNLWIVNSENFYSDTTLEANTSSYKDYTLDLSNYLPNDGEQYEVSFLLAASSGNMIIYSDLDGAWGGYVGSGEQRSQILVPVGTGRHIVFRVHRTTTNIYFSAAGYRKVL